MFKGASDKQAFMQRVASHATKPSRRGIIKDIPEWAAEPEEYYRSLRERYDALRVQITAIVEEQTYVNRRLLSPLPVEEFDRLRHQQHTLSAQKVMLEKEIGEYKFAARAAAINAYGTVFLFVARRTLDAETMVKLHKEVEEIIGRRFPEDDIRASKPPDERPVHNPPGTNAKNAARNATRKRARVRRSVQREARDNLEISWELIDGKYRRVVIKNGIRFVDDKPEPRTPTYKP